MTYVVAQTGDDNISDDGSVNEAVVAGVIAGVVVVWLSWSWAFSGT